MTIWIATHDGITTRGRIELEMHVGYWLTEVQPSRSSMIGGLYATLAGAKARWRREWGTDWIWEEL